MFHSIPDRNNNYVQTFIRLTQELEEKARKIDELENLLQL